MKKIEYEDLDKHFTEPKIISPFYKDNIRIPRKIKKKVKKHVGIHWKGLTNGQRLWHYLESNPNYKRFLIKKVCDNEEKLKTINKN